LTTDLSKSDKTLQEMTHYLQTINAIEVKDIDLVDEMSGDSGEREDNSDAKEIKELKEEINELEKHLAFIEVSILENQSMEALLSTEKQMKTQIQCLEKEISDLSEQISGQQFTAMAIEADIRRYNWQ
jgi:DNA repair exonuclease SbcCD ATPase subunit